MRTAEVTVTRASVAEIEASPDLAALLDEYGAESANHEIGSVSPQVETYKAMETAGVLIAFAARIDDRLIGFMFLLVCTLPHFGKMIGSVESYFVASAHRKTGAGLRLLHAAEDAALEKGAVGVLLSAPIGGRLAQVMPRVGYRETNRVFFKGLQ